jgi:peptidoglycan hydrolase-like protein with peptidoglycan-binding domain
MGLQSQLLRGDPKLEAAALSDPAHILPGAFGPHVGKIQQALIQLDGAAIAQDSAYGPATAAAVAAFKRKRQILNFQGAIDNIVGMKTIAALDAEMLAKERRGGSPPGVEAATAVLAVLKLLDAAVARTGARLPLDALSEIGRIRRQAAAIAPNSGADPDTFPFTPEFAKGIQSSRQTFGIVPAVAAGVGLTAAEIALILAILALLAVTAIAVFDPDFAAELKRDVIEKATEALIEGLFEIAAIRQLVERCRQAMNPNPSPKCLQALADFEAKFAEVTAKRAELQVIITDLTSRVTTLFDKARLERAAQLVVEIAKLMKELRAIADRIRTECGCRFTS